MVNAKFHKMDAPSGKDVCRKQFFHFMDKLMQADVSHGDYETYMADLMEKFADVSKEEVLQRIASLEFNHFLKYYENAEDLNSTSRREYGQRTEGNFNRDDSSPRRERSSSPQRDNGYARLFINLGTKDGFYKSSFLQFILDESNLSKEVLGRIDMKEMNSWIEIDKAAAAKMIKSIDGKKHNGRQIRMNEADGGFKRAGGDDRSDRGDRSGRTEERRPEEGRKRIPMSR